MRLAPIVAAVLLAAGARAQTAGGISGVVVDEDGAPVARAVLIVSGPALQGERTASTDPSGVFDLPQLPPGAYSIDVHCFGYASFTQEGVAVHLASTTQVTLRMLHEAGAAAGRRPQPSAISMPVVTAAQMELIPYGREVRSFEQAALAAPGLTRLAPGLHGPGTLADETRFVVDGIDVTDPDRRVLATRLLQNFVEEVAVRTIPLAAEYGRASGALISAVTRSGGNEFHGSVFAGAIGDPRAIDRCFAIGCGSTADSPPNSSTAAGPISSTRASCRGGLPTTIRWRCRRSAIQAATAAAPATSRSATSVTPAVSGWRASAASTIRAAGRTVWRRGGAAALSSPSPATIGSRPGSRPTRRWEPPSRRTAGRCSTCSQSTPASATRGSAASI